MQAQRDLEGIAVLDKEEVIQNFKEKTQKPDKEENEYNIMGKVPLVNAELAQKYVILRRNLKE